MRRGRNRLDPGGHAELWTNPGERRAPGLRSSAVAGDERGDVVECGHDVRRRAGDRTGRRGAREPSPDRLDVACHWRQCGIRRPRGHDGRERCRGRGIEFGQSAWSSEAKSSQKPSSPSVEMLAGTDGIATDGTDEAVAPEHAVSATAATATRPKMERRTDIRAPLLDTSRGDTIRSVVASRLGSSPPA